MASGSAIFFLAAAGNEGEHKSVNRMIADRSVADLASSGHTEGLRAYGDELKKLQQQPQLLGTAIGV